MISNYTLIHVIYNLGLYNILCIFIYTKIVNNLILFNESNNPEFINSKPNPKLKSQLNILIPQH